MFKHALLYALLVVLCAQSALAQSDDTKQDFGIDFHGFVKTDMMFDSRQNVTIREGHFLLYPAPELMDTEGEDINETPNLDRIAARGMLLTHCCTNAPLCVPARIAVATVDKIDLNAADVLQRAVVDDHADTLVFAHKVVVVQLVGKGHSEAYAAASTRRRKNAYTLDIFFDLPHQFGHFALCRRGKGEIGFGQCCLGHVPPLRIKFEKIIEKESEENNEKSVQDHLVSDKRGVVAVP